MERLPLRQQLLGSWELVSYAAFKTDDPAAKFYPGGKGVEGILIYTENGYMSAQLQVPGQMPFASNNAQDGTQEEFADVGRHYLAYTGAFRLDESGNRPVVHHRIINCSFPNWRGETQQRSVTFKSEAGDVLLVLGIEDGGDVSELTWRKLPDNV